MAARVFAGAKNSCWRGPAFSKAQSVPAGCPEKRSAFTRMEAPSGTKLLMPSSAVVLKASGEVTRQGPSAGMAVSMGIGLLIMGRYMLRAMRRRR
jgi:hypothetical protein